MAHDHDPALSSADSNEERGLARLMTEAEIAAAEAAYQRNREMDAEDPASLAGAETAEPRRVLTAEEQDVEDAFARAEERRAEEARQQLEAQNYIFQEDVDFAFDGERDPLAATPEQSGQPPVTEGWENRAAGHRAARRNDTYAHENVASPAEIIDDEEPAQSTDVDFDSIPGNNEAGEQMNLFETPTSETEDDEQETGTQYTGGALERAQRRVADFINDRVVNPLHDAADKQVIKSAQREAFDSYEENIQATAARERQEKVAAREAKADQDRAFASYKDNLNVTATRERSEARAARETAEASEQDSNEQGRQETDQPRGRFRRMGTAIRNLFRRRNSERTPVTSRETDGDQSDTETSTEAAAANRAGRSNAGNAAREARRQRIADRKERNSAAKAQRKEERKAQRIASEKIWNPKAAEKRAARLQRREAKRQRREQEVAFQRAAITENLKQRAIRKAERREKWRDRREAAKDNTAELRDKAIDKGRTIGRAAGRKAKQTRAAVAGGYEGTKVGWRSVE